jgi:hypothetical protein
MLCFFKAACKTRTKFHFTVGHATVMGQARHVT